MKRPTLKGRFGESESSVDDQTTGTITEALSSNDKIIEIRPVRRSNGMGLKRLIVLGAGAIGFAYWVRNSQKPDELIENVKETAIGEKASERMEEADEKAMDGAEIGASGHSET